MDQAYAPPFSSGKSPANIVSFVADDMVQKISRNKSWKDIELIYDDSIVLLDVRSADDVARGAIKNSINIPLHQLRDRLSEIPRGKKIYVYCASGLRSYLAARILEQNGFPEVWNLSGGYRTWNAASHQWRATGAQGTSKVVKDGDISNG
jgi:rhodanese-related sulfurtransferase